MSQVPDKIDIVEVAAPAEIAEIDLYQRREKIYTRNIEGFYQRIRLYSGWPLLLAYFLLPWINWGERQAILFDLPARKFHILGLTLWPQDFPLLAALLIIAAFGLFTVTVFAGRVWCGYTCPQTVWTAIFMWWEQKTEGSRNQRIKLDAAPWSISKARRKVLKHGGWLVFSALTGATFIAYFYPARDLFPELLSLQTGPWQASWTVFFSLATYINAGWLREQVCLYMCPYARFQSVMFDQDTLIVSYDPARGEPRGARRHDADLTTAGLGDCIDCELCVQVCPTGIDIRNGLQYECIGCALCIDACDSIMDRMQYPRGLIRYTSERQLTEGRGHWLRPRMIGYLTAMLVFIVAFGSYLLMRVPLELTAIRDRDSLYHRAADGIIENIFTLQLANMDETAHEFVIRIEGLPDATMLDNPLHWVEGGEVRTLIVRIAAPEAGLELASTPFHFIAEATDRPALTRRAESRFLRPLEEN